MVVPIGDALKMPQPLVIAKYEDEIQGLAEISLFGGFAGSEITAER